MLIHFLFIVGGYVFAGTELAKEEPFVFWGSSQSAHLSARLCKNGAALEWNSLWKLTVKAVSAPQVIQKPRCQLRQPPGKNPGDRPRKRDACSLRPREAD